MLVREVQYLRGYFTPQSDLDHQQVWIRWEQAPPTLPQLQDLPPLRLQSNSAWTTNLKDIEAE